MKRGFALLLAVGTLLYAVEGWSFGREGHQIVCAVAYQLLDPAVQAKVDRLLEALPASQRVGINRFLRRPETAPIDFADSCVWPDVVKRDDEYAATNVWHYINVQREDTVVAMDDCMEGCLLSAIDHHSVILRSPLGEWPRAQALMFVGHWVADIHQPMHVSFGDDRGGNGTAVQVPGATANPAVPNQNCSNLHVIWDFCIIEESGMSEAAIVHEIMAQLKADKAGVRIGGSPLEWANESLDLSRSPGVGYCVQQGKRCEAIPAPAVGSRSLPAEYYRANWPLLETRMKRAGVRLASLLTQLLS